MDSKSTNYVHQELAFLLSTKSLAIYGLSRANKWGCAGYFAPMLLEPLLIIPP